MAGGAELGLTDSNSSCLIRSPGLPDALVCRAQGTPERRSPGPVNHFPIRQLHYLTVMAHTACTVR